MSLSALIPPPVLVRRRAWECAYVLITDYRARLHQGEVEAAAWCVALGETRLGWDQIGDMFRLYRRTVEVRI